MQDSNIYKIKTHPQLSAPHKFVMGELNNTNHPYEFVGVNVNDLNPTQPFIDTDVVDGMVKKLNAGEQLKPIWVSENNDILDGHHRFAAHMLARPDGAVPAIRIKCKTKDGIDLLNEIESTFRSHKARNDQSELLKSLSEEDNSMYIQDRPAKTKKETLRAYRKYDLKKSNSGNFFTLRMLPGSKPYDIDFVSLLDTDTIEKKISNSQNPPMELLKYWFPTLNIQKAAKDFSMPEGDFINAVVAEKARIKGIDGIKYGDKLLQSIDDK